MDSVPRRTETSTCSLQSRAVSLCSALKQRKLFLVKELLVQGDGRALIEAYKMCYRTPVLCSVIRSWHCPHLPLTSDRILESMQAILEELVIAGADINEPENGCYFDTPLTLAMQFGNLQLCKMLLDLGARINILPHAIHKRSNPLFYRSVLSMAVKAGPEFVDLILQHCSGLTHTEQDYLLSSLPLHEIAMCPKTIVVELFMDWCKKIGHEFPWDTIIDLAFTWEKEDNVIVILQRGYHSSLKENIGYHEMCFKKAAIKKFTKVMLLLCEQKPELVNNLRMLNVWLPQGFNSASRCIGN